MTHKQRLTAFSAVFCISVYLLVYIFLIREPIIIPFDTLTFVTSYFKPEDTRRSAEIDICLASAIANPFIKHVHILSELKDQQSLPSFAVNSPKVTTATIGSRTLMGDFIQYSCDHLYDHDRVFFSNADIFFDTSLEYLSTISAQHFDSTFFSISRWFLDDGTDDSGGALKPNRRHGKVRMNAHPFADVGSYDTFAFHPRTICHDKDKVREIVLNLNYTLGVLGSENRLLYEIKRQYPKIHLENPYKYVKTVHIHKSNTRPPTWKYRVDTHGKSRMV
ncbi:putative ATP-dependent RNA helicase ddx49 [Podila humilis]|nr:putative ATP-dependent RNA helicase ddx49 [Podila humilis]